jgi:Ser/Thr protein kinase RdoA (MazF antagonist)
MTDPRVAHCLRLLGQPPADPASVRPLAGAGSGSAVYRLTTGTRDAVLKITTAASWRAHARRETDFYQSLATRVPVRVPTLLAAADTDDVTCLLLATAEPLPPPAEWDATRWLEVAAQLGHLHTTSVTADGWLRRVPAPTLEPPAVETRAAEGPAAEAGAPALEFWRREGLGGLAEELVGRLGELSAAVDALPACLVHGDCHAANLLADGGGLVWADWQEVGLGHGPEDLALLWQRAEADGGRPPREEMLAAYAAARGIPDGPVLRRAVAAAEIRLLLLAWPGFLVRAEPGRRAAMVGLLRRLGAGWSSVAGGDDVGAFDHQDGRAFRDDGAV